MDEETLNGLRLTQFGRLLVEELGLNGYEVEAVISCGVESDAELLEFVGLGEHTAALAHCPSARYKVERWYWAMRRAGWASGRIRPVAPIHRRFQAAALVPRRCTKGPTEQSPGDPPPGRGPARAVSPTAPRRWEDRFNPYVRTSDAYGEHWRTHDARAWKLAGSAPRRGVSAPPAQRSPSAVIFAPPLRQHPEADRAEQAAAGADLEATSYAPPLNWTEFQPAVVHTRPAAPHIDGLGRWGEAPYVAGKAPSEGQPAAGSPRRVARRGGSPAEHSDGPVYGLGDARAPSQLRPWRPSESPAAGPFWYSPRRGANVSGFFI